MNLIGRFNQAEVFTENIDNETISQIYQLLNIPAFADSQIRIMPDVHYGNGTVVGFTMTTNKYICPRVIGVDIGCGVSAFNIGKVDFELPEFDHYLRENVPSGRDVNSERKYNYFEPSKELLDLITKVGRKDYDRILKSVGTLGGGNHFIELAKDDEGNVWLQIHSGSRFLGVLVCDFHQQQARKYMIDKYKGAGAYHGFEFIDIDEGGMEYIEDMKLTQQYASTNRAVMAETLIEGFFKTRIKKCEQIESVHNYIDFKDNVVRKGAISARKDVKLIIPMNMRDGSLIARGKGNENWNISAPHGAGRLLSRSEAKELISLSEFQESMQGIYSTSVDVSTIDESPMAYKPMNEIVSKIHETVEIISIIKPIYNYKSGS